MIFPDVLGHEHPRAMLARLLTSGRIPHALLFHGPEGVGKRLVAGHFATSLVCTDPGKDQAACMRCGACVKASHGNHPDLLVVTRLPKVEAKGADGSETDDDEDGGDTKGGDLRRFIVVQQIRELAEHAVYAPREGRRRIFIIDPADRMNAESQNALLKTLEEPPERTLIILIASRPHALLPTVRSRCFQLGFAPLPAVTLAEGLAARGMPADEAGTRAALAEGRAGRAMTLDLELVARRRDAVLGALEALAASPRATSGLTEFVADILGDDESAMLEGLDLVVALLRDAARAASGDANILHADVASRVGRLGQNLGAPRAAELLALADRLRGDLRLNVNKTLLTETLLAAVAGGPVPA